MADRDLLADYLADRNPDCPACGYRLTGLTADRCPECGYALELCLREPRSGLLMPWGLMIAGLAVASGSGVYQWVFNIYSFTRAQFFQVYSWVELAIGLAEAACLVMMIVAFFFRRRFARLTPRQRWRVAVFFGGIGFATFLTDHIEDTWRLYV